MISRHLHSHGEGLSLIHARGHVQLGYLRIGQRVARKGLIIHRHAARRQLLRRRAHILRRAVGQHHNATLRILRQQGRGQRQGGGQVGRLCVHRRGHAVIRAILRQGLFHHGIAAKGDYARVDGGILVFKGSPHALGHLILHAAGGGRSICQYPHRLLAAWQHHRGRGQRQHAQAGKQAAHHARHPVLDAARAPSPAPVNQINQRNIGRQQQQKQRSCELKRHAGSPPIQSAAVPGMPAAPTVSARAQPPFPAGGTAPRRPARPRCAHRIPPRRHAR